MKKFLVVLLLLVVASLAYSVGGSLYMRYNSTGNVVATEWGLLDDLRVGRRGTGFDLNFDAFTLSYKLRSDVNLGEWQMNGALNDINKALGVDAYAGAITLNTPGYVQFSGLKAGPANMSFGLAWWHYDRSAYTKVEASGSTVETSLSVGANIIGADFTFDWSISESMRLHIDPWDKVNVYIGLGDANVKTTVTNTASSGYFKLILPVHFSMNFDTVGLEIFPKMTFISYGGKYALSSGETNDNSFNQIIFGLMARLNVALAEGLGFYLHAGYVYDTANGIVNSTLGTNTNNLTQMEAPIFIGLKVQPAGPITLNIGGGYLVELGDSSTVPSPTTNQPAGGLIGEYAYFDEHGYQNPFLRFAGSAKFASDWEIGMSTIVYWSQDGIATQGASGNYYSGGVTSTATSKTTSYDYQLLHFKYFNDWDGGGNGFGANYLQFSKDNVTIRGHITDGGGLWGLFGFVDVSFAF